MSVHSIKKTAYSKVGLTPGDVQQQQLSSYTLYDHFKEVNMVIFARNLLLADSMPFSQTFGPPSSSGFRRAQSCFMKSLASYCIVCYLLQIKDRHNGNILIDRLGHIIRESETMSCLILQASNNWAFARIDIDFGFLLSNSPGQLGFEMAPFKLPQEYIDILGGLDSERFQDFRTLMKQCFWSARKQAESIIMIVELMQKGESLIPRVFYPIKLTLLLCRFFSALFLVRGSDSPALEATLPAVVITGAVRRVCGSLDRLFGRIRIHASI